MAGNSFGTNFRITTFGESHGPAIGVVIDGCPAGIKIDQSHIQTQLNLRKPGQSAITTQRKENDEFHILSGVFEEKTTGSPIAIIINNEGQRSQDYDHIKEQFRPSHADYTYFIKYGHRDYRGGGRASARETAARVIAGAIAKQILSEKGIEIFGWVSSVGHLSSTMDDFSDFKLAYTLRESNPVRCPDTEAANQMEELIRLVRKEGDTIGGKISVIISGVPAGLGEPVFDKLHAELGKAVLSINAVHGFEYGSGFAGTEMRGSAHNDQFVNSENNVQNLKTETNFSGGIQGGISNGMDIKFRVGFKPIATLMRPQSSIDSEGNQITIEGKGRHDPCVVPRAVVIVESMAALVILDHLYRALKL